MCCVPCQYRPYAAPTVFYGNGSAGSQSGTQGGSGLLTGEEKIAEMLRVVEMLTSDRDRMARELEEVQAEKVGPVLVLYVWVLRGVGVVLSGCWV